MDEVRALASDVEIMTEVDNWLGLITKEILPAGYVIQNDIPKITRRPCSQLLTSRFTRTGIYIYAPVEMSLEIQT